MFDWLWPIACLGCAELSETPWCADCAPGSTLRPPIPSFGISRAFSIERYDRPVGRALGHAKLTSDRVAGRKLAQLFAQTMAAPLAGSAPTALVPAPSTRSTRSRRGFSMAALLAEALSAQMGVPVVHALRSTAPARLATLRREARRKALQGRVRSVRDIPGRVILVDDVLTTGATAEACAVELLGGASTDVVLATLCAVPLAPRRPMKRVHVS